MDSYVELKHLRLKLINAEPEIDRIKTIFCGNMLINKMKRKMEAIMFCPNCGTKLSETETYCHHCGKKIDSSKKQRNRFPKGIFVVLAILSIILIGVMLIKSTNINAGDSIKTYIRDENLQEENDTGAFVLDVVLPDENMDFAAFVSDLSEDRWDNMFSYTATHEVRITLPKFKIESEYDLKRPLQALGMTLPYDRDNVDLKGIAYPTLTGVSSPSIVLSESRQKAVIEVDEDGTTAATVTHHKGDWNLLPAPGEIIVFNADHPFVFLIREKSSDTILFMGTLTE